MNRRLFLLVLVLFGTQRFSELSIREDGCVMVPSSHCGQYDPNIIFGDAYTVDWEYAS